MGEIEKVDPEAALAEAAAAVQAARNIAEQAGTGSELALAGQDNAVETKARFGAAYSQIATARKEAAEKVEAAKSLIKAQKDEMDRVQRALELELAPLLKQMDRLKDGIEALNLYLGRDEELIELRDGESAPADTPLVIRQAVLAMDEESALFADEGGLDFQDIDVFTEWLLESEEHLAQVIPDAKGVVAVMARRTAVDYTGNAMADADRNKANFHTHWLLRNGQRLYFMTTDFSVGDLLIPTRRSFTKLFEDRDGNALEPGSSSWRKAEEHADEMTRHYMKVALILQGLVARTAVFHPLPEGGLDLLGNAAYDTGKAVLIEEEEKAIGTGRQPFNEWLRERTDRLEVGMRVVGSWPRWESGSRSEITFVTPKFAEGISSSEVYTIAREDASNWYFSFTRTDTVYRDDFWNGQSSGPAKTKGSYRIEKNSYRSASFVPIDTVTVPEMEEYLAARTERKEYARMFPALKAAIAFKQAEAAAEAPFRALLADAIFKIDPESTAEEVYELITWWKTSNKWHRALNGEPAHEARAVKAILAEYKRRQQPVSREAMLALNGVSQHAIVTARRTNDVIAVIPETRAYGSESVPQNLFVQIHVFTDKGNPVEVQRWKTLSRAQVAKWTILGETDRWAEWQLNPQGQHLTDAQVAAAVELMLAAGEAHRGPLSVVKYHEEDATGGRLLGYWPSEKRSDDWNNRRGLVQPHFSSHVKVDRAGAVSLVNHYDEPLKIYVENQDWQTDYDRSHFDRNAMLLPKSPHTINWHGAYPGAVVFTNPELLAADMVVAGLWADNLNSARKASQRLRDVQDAVKVGWETYELEARRQRFVEDFGDPELWEDHSKSQKPTPFPLTNYGAEPIQEFAQAVIDAGLYPSQSRMTIGQILEHNLGGRTVPGIPPELLPVTIDLSGKE